MLLGTGSSREPVGVVAQRLLAAVEGLRGIERAGIASLSACVGVGVTKACRIQAALELGARVAGSPLSPGRPLRSSADVDAALRPRVRGATQEHFFAIALDAKNRPLSEILVAVGGLTACAITPSDVFRLILREPAAAVIFAHNHPSGEPAPSEEDVAITERLRRAGVLLGVAVLDHLILGHDSYFSFLDAGLLNTDPGVL